MPARARRRNPVFIWTVLGGSLLANLILGAVFLSGVSSRTELLALLRPSHARALLDYRTIICWGDSLTAGAGASFGASYPRVLQTMTGAMVVNEGVGGETSTEIKKRMLAHRRQDDAVIIIWAGRNNFDRPEQVQSDIAEMVSSVPPSSRYLVLGVTNGDYQKEYRGGDRYNLIAGINENLSISYKGRFIPVLDYLSSRYDSRLKDEISDHDRGIVPKSLRSDEAHLNDRGYALVATQIVERLLSLVESHTL